VDHSITDQTSILKFIEDNWSTGQIGNSSFDQLAGPLNAMFDFSGKNRADTLFLNPATGQPVKQN
jgi:phospholipase C